MIEIPSQIYAYDTVESTQSKAKDLLKEGCPAGSVIIAETQSAGRGRLGRAWKSPRGVLYFSVLLRGQAKRPLTDVSLLTGVAIAQSLQSFLPKSVEISLKWPNDILLGWKKVAGILCESSGDESLVIVGIGINVNLDEQDLSDFDGKFFGATSLKKYFGGEFDAKQLLKLCLQKLSEVYSIYSKEGFEVVKYLWEKNCLMIGKKIEVSESRDLQGSGPKITGTFLGIDKSGELLLETSRGEKRSFVSGEILCFWP